MAYCRSWGFAGFGSDSLLVVALALAGATVVPSRDAGRSHASIIWQAADRQQAPATAKVDRHRPTSSPGATPTTVPQRATASPVRHALYQRPPPHLSAT